MTAAKKILAFGFIAATLSLCVPAAADATWQFAGWYGGGAFPELLPDPHTSGRCYLLSDVAGLWRSDDRGNSWNFITTGLENLHCADLAIAPSDSNVLYLGGELGIHKSTDAGEHWHLLAATTNKITLKRPDDGRSIAVDRADPDKVFAGTFSGEIYSSADGGQTWSRVGASVYPFGAKVPVTALYLTSDGASLFAASKNGVLKYDFSQNTWSKVTPLWGVEVDDLAGQGAGAKEIIYAAAGNRVFYGVKGTGWEETEPISQGAIYRLAVRTDEKGVVHFLAAWISGWSGGVYASDDGGDTWEDIKQNLVHDVVGDPTRVWTQGFGKPLSVAFDPFTAKTLYFTDWWGAWRSDDGGASWIERIRGAANTVGSDIKAAPSGLYVATMDNGLLKSDDEGVSYHALFPTAAYDSTECLGHVWRVLVLGSSGLRIVATTSPWDVDMNYVIVSEDGGKTFNLVSNGLPSERPVKNTVWDKGYARALAADPSNPNRLYLGIDGDDGGGLFTSTDGGYHWTHSPGQPASKRIYNALAVDPTNSARIFWGAEGDGGGVYRSQDYGRTWLKVFSGSAYIFDLTISADGAIYAASDSGGPALYVSRDHGATWSLLKQFEGVGPAEAITVDPSNPARLAVSSIKWNDGADCRIYLSGDAGKTWQDITGNLPNGAGAAAMAFSRDGYLYISRYAGSVYRVKV